jgi:hypothetical protein
MRVRISFDALRLCLLVAAGVTSGYLWRAAFESSSPAEARSAAGPRIVEKAPAPPVVRIAPHHLTTTARRPAVAHHIVSHAFVRTHGSQSPLISTHVASTPPPAAAPTGPPPESPSPPKPSPAPTPPPATPTGPPPQTPPSPVVAAPVQQVAAPPPTTTTTPGASGDDARPGWGKGDQNHDHSGPGGKGK